MDTLFNTVPILAKNFAPQSFITRTVIVGKLWLVLIVTRLFKFPLTVFIPVNPEINFAVSSIAGVAALKEVFVDDEYKWNLVDDPKVIIDLGGHCGDTALYYHLKYPEAKIFVVEPLPENVFQIKTSLGAVKNIVIIEAAISDHDGVIELFATDKDNSLGSSLSKSKYTTHSISVPALKLQSLFEKYEISKADLIKFDIEGGEEYLFGDQAPEDFADAYIGEVHTDLMKKFISIESFTAKFDSFNIVTNESTKKGRYILKAQKI